MGSPLSRSRALAVALGAGALVASQAAPAQAQQGVYRDPGGPAGHEYAVPIDQARQEATGSPSKPSESSHQAPLFGQGVTHASPPAEGRAAQPRSTKPHAARPRSTKRHAARPRPTKARRSRGAPQLSGPGDARLAAAPATPDLNTGWPLAVGAGLVAAATLLGFGLRRLLR